MPEDWKKGHLVKLPKKRDLSSCNNWRGITLLSIPGKVLTRIILERLKAVLDKTLWDEQAGFRQDRSCIDHIATMRINIKQSFVDFQKAFDSVDRDVIWRLMHHYGFPPESVSSNDCMKMLPAKSSMMGSGRNPSSYKPAFVRDVSCRQPSSCCGRLDNAAGHGRQENWNTVDFHEAVGRHGLRRRHQPSLRQTLSRARKAMPCRRRSGEDWPPNQHREDGGHEGEQQKARPSATTPRTHQGSRQVCLPGQCSQ